MSLADKLMEVVRRLTPSGGRTERMVKSAIWLMSQNVVARVLGLATLVVLARLIGPSEIGLMGIALLALAAVNTFTNIGLNAALIQQKENDVDKYLNTTWLLEIGRGVVMGLALVLAAPLVASVFNEPRVTDVLRVIALSPVIRGLKNPGIVYFQKNLDFHKQFVYEIGSSVVQAVIAIGYVFVSPTVWAYVAGFVAADVFRVVVSYPLHEYRPWPRFDRSIAAELVDYGKWITGSSILHFLYGQGDDAIVGWLVNPAALAFYRYGYRFSNAPATELGQVVASVMFPAFSKVQDDVETLRSMFLQSVKMTSFVSLPAAFGIAVVAPTFVRGFLGSDWTQAIVPMQILTIYAIGASLGQTFGPLWKAIGRPDYVTKLSAVRVALLAVLLIPATMEYGIVGTAVVVSGVQLIVMLPLDIYIMLRLLDMRWTSVATELGYPVIASTVMALTVHQVRVSVSVHPIAEFVILVVVGVVTYVAAAAVIDSQSDWGVIHYVRQFAVTAKS